MFICTFQGDTLYLLPEIRKDSDILFQTRLDIKCLVLLFCVLQIILFFNDYIEMFTEKNINSCSGSFLTSVFLNKLRPAETSTLTLKMKESGDCLTWPDDIQRLTIDKHSTGGVGDKISLPLAPALAACGYKVWLYRTNEPGYIFV